MVDFFKGPLLMGVVNVTPDSFSDGGDYFDKDKAAAHAFQLIEDGANILDIGGESTRPRAEPVSVEEEQKRVLPVLETLKKQGVKTPISIDTRHADTMQKSIDLGVDIINDISALTNNSESLNVVSKAQIPVILMHMQGTPETMQNKPVYDDVVSDIMAYMSGRIAVCTQAGVDPKNIICDPGIGFGKTLENNLSILKNLDKFHSLDCPILLGASRKSFIEKLCPNTSAKDRLAGSLAAALQGLENGVQIFRVHDVKETRQAFDVWQAIQSV
jgi:dihydropteroate synthase